MTPQKSAKGELSGKLFLIVGPSGSGKGTVIKELKKHYRSFVYPLSYTTRSPRKELNESDVYHFVSRAKFKDMIKKHELLEYAVVHSNNYYGTSKKDILDALARGTVVVREIDIQGFHSIQKLIPKENLVSIFMKVADLEDLKTRILRRGKMTNDELERRMDSAIAEISQAGDCDYQVENKWGEIDKCVQDVERIILSEIKSCY